VKVLYIYMCVVESQHIISFQACLCTEISYTELVLEIDACNSVSKKLIKYLTCSFTFVHLILPFSEHVNI
jgi:hypothetical protein